MNTSLIFKVSKLEIKSQIMVLVSVLIKYAKIILNKVVTRQHLSQYKITKFFGMIFLSLVP